MFIKKIGFVIIDRSTVSGANPSGLFDYNTRGRWDEAPENNPQQ